MKQRFSSLDLAAIVNDLRSQLVGLRVANIYDINPKTFLIKFAKPDLKEILLIESGVRLHTTVFARDKNKTPGGFATKLRKHLKSKRLCEIRQLGADRIVDLRFGDNEFVELYAAGNIILTDWQYKIVAILRTVNLDGGAATLTSKTPVGKADGPATAPADGEATIKSQPQSEEILFRVGETYVTELGKPFQPLIPERIKAELDVYFAALDATKQVEDGEAETPLDATAGDMVAPQDKGRKKGSAQQQRGKKTKKFERKPDTRRKDAGGTIKKWARERFGTIYGPALVDHAVAISGLDATAPLSDFASDDLRRIELQQALEKGFLDANSIMEQALGGAPSKGWITRIAHKAATDSTATTGLVTFDEYHPYLFAHINRQQESFECSPLEFPTFDKAVDQFYSLIESQRLAYKARQLDQAATKKIEAVKAKHETHVAELASVREVSSLKAAAIEANLEIVDGVISLVGSLVRSGMDWGDIWSMIKEEKARCERARKVSGARAWLDDLLGGVSAGEAGSDVFSAGAAGPNPVVESIVGVKLQTNTVTIELLDPEFVEEESDDDGSDDDESDDNSESGDEDSLHKKKLRQARIAEREKLKRQREAKRQEAMLKIDLDINTSAYANAKAYYDSRKLADVKVNKTILAGDKALKVAEKKIQHELKAKEAKVPSMIRVMRKPWWFEKFQWFISSENYLVLAGRDAIQTDMLLRRYRGPNDVCLHADLPGAPVVLVKNPYQITGASTSDSIPPGLSKEQPVPPLTLHQAGTMAVVYSKAWESKIVTSAWWIRSEQVELPETGIVDTLIFRGKKAFLPPAQLIYGFGLLFLLGERDDITKHIDERRPWLRSEAWAPVVSEIVGDASKNPEIVSDSQADTNKEDGEAGDEEDSDVKGDDLPPERAAQAEDDANMEAQLVAGFEKYGIEDKLPQHEVVPPENDATIAGGAASETKSKKRISAKQRKDLKKGKPNDIEQDAAEALEESEKYSARDDDEADDTRSTAAASTAHSARTGATRTTATAATFGAGPLPRGKRGKLKKMRDKYGDQDEEDREVMMQVLGSAHGERRRAEEAERAAKAEADLQRRRKEEAERRAAAIERAKANAAQKRDAAAARAAAAAAADRDPDAPAGAEDDDDDDGDDENAGARLDMLDLLTAKPLAGDSVVAAIPVCAPWTCMAKYQIKVKLIPGSLKKGKAAKSALVAFEAMAKAGGGSEADATGLPPLQDLVASIQEADAVNAMLGKVNVSGGGVGGAGGAAKGSKGGGSGAGQKKGTK
ncbi:hypothetical protein HK405_003067, partial [Cladochytrium tenue]